MRMPLIGSCSVTNSEPGRISPSPQTFWPIRQGHRFTWYSKGQQIWLTRYDSPTNGSDQMRGMAMGTNGSIFVTGTSKTLKLAPGGTPLWTAPYGGRGVAADPNGNSYVTGFSELDYATVKLD